MPSAMGDRQMFPVQTSRTEAIGGSVYRVPSPERASQDLANGVPADRPRPEDAGRITGEIDDRGGVAGAAASRAMTGRARPRGRRFASNNAAVASASSARAAMP